ncbi:MAG: metallophosphoesterase, partial [Thermoproteota archaeon]
MSEVTGKGLVIASTADIHSPKYLEDLKTAVKRVKDRPKLVLLAGDLINKGKIEWYGPTIEVISQLRAEKIIAIFGNEEYDEIHDRLREEFGDLVIFLDDESISLD